MKTLNKRCMRGIGAICCVICMMIMLCTGTQFAYAQNSTEIVAVSSSVEKGGTAKVALNLSNNPGIWGLKFKVGYNHDVMTLKTVTVGDVFGQGEVTLPETLDKEQFVFYASGNTIANKTADGTLAVLEFQVSDTAALADYAITLEMTQAIDVDGNDVTIQMTNGKVSVVKCLHSEKEWKVTELAKCEKKGTETETCKKCGETFGTRDVKATGHVNTEIKNKVAATEKAEGYTGDTYCTDCNKLIKKGSVIAKIEKPQEPEDTEVKAPVTGEVDTEETETQEPEESEKPEKQEKPAGTDDTNKGEKNDSPMGGVIGVILVVGIAVALVFMYIKFIKKGR